MQKTTVYVPTDFRASLRRMACDAGISAAEVIRQAVSERGLRHPCPDRAFHSPLAGLAIPKWPIALMGCSQDSGADNR